MSKAYRPTGQRPEENSLTLAERRALVDWFLTKYRVAERLLLARHKRFVRILHDRGYGEDIPGQCFLALVRASELFQPSKGFQFDTYALPHQYSFCQKLISFEGRTRGLAGGRVVSDPEAVEGKLTSEDGCAAVDLEDLRAKVRQILLWHAMTPRQTETVLARFPDQGERLTNLEMGRREGLSRGASWQRINHIVQQAIRWGLTPEKAGRMLGIL